MYNYLHWSRRCLQFKSNILFILYIIVCSNGTIVNSYSTTLLSYLSLTPHRHISLEKMKDVKTDYLGLAMLLLISAYSINCSLINMCLDINPTLPIFSLFVSRQSILFVELSIEISKANAKFISTFCLLYPLDINQYRW